MPDYQLLRAKGSQFGLNQKTRADDLAPGEAVTAQNVEFDRNSIKKCRGTSNVALGQTDSVVWKGGPPGSSLYVQGDPWWLEHPEVDALDQQHDGLWQGSSSTANMFRNPFHGRHGVIMVPEGGLTSLRLNPKNTGSADPKWAMEIGGLWSDDLYLAPKDIEDVSDAYYPIVVMSKAWSVASGQARQWRVVINTDAAAASADNLKFHIALQIIETDGEYHTFRYESSAGVAGSFFEPGKRHWVAWVGDPDNTTITSYYWQEGGSVVTSSQDYSGMGDGTLDANGNTATPAPIMIGGQTYGKGIRNFNGTVAELRFYDSAVGNAALTPTFNGDYAFFEKEFTDADITTQAAATDLKLYYSFSAERVSDTKFVLPRYREGGSESNSRAWLTGADATWETPTGTKFGDRALSFMPSGPALTDEYAAFYRGLVHQDVSGTASAGSLDDLGPVLFGSGIRVPNGDKYLANLGTGAAKGLRALPGFSVAVAFTVDDVDDDFTSKRVLFQTNRALKGTSGSSETWNYAVARAIEISIDNSSTNWRVAAHYQTRAAGQINIVGTTNLEAGEKYVATFTVMFDELGSDGNEVGHLYLSNKTDVVVQEGKNTSAYGSYSTSQHTDSADSGDNKNDADNRTLCFPMAIGCSVQTGADKANGRNFMFGAEHTVGSESTASISEPARRWWAFHRNLTSNGVDCRKTANDGCAYRGYEAHRGQIGWVGIWAKKLTEAEVNSFRAAPPSNTDIRGYGRDLLSLWLMDEGGGSLVYDHGPLGNHLDIHPYPQVRAVAGPISRGTKSNILQIEELRTRTLREGISRREIYGLTNGSICRLVDGTSADTKTWEAISSHQFDSSAVLGSSFQFSDFLYWCSGVGPVLRISRNRVTSAGISGPFSDRQNDNLGWQEGDRDGTFQIVQGGSGTVFDSGGTYSYAVTFYDPESGTESTPSRLVPWTATGDKASLTLSLLPRSHDKHVRRYRIYRTTKNGGIFRFLDEIEIQPYYVDNTTDEDLVGAQLNTFQNRPPPQNARIGIQFGARAIYAGVPDSPATLFVSKENYPEACPIEYQITVASGRSDEITAIHVMHGRALIFLQDMIFMLADSGGDVGPNALITTPLQLETISDQTGCVNHQTLAYIDQVGLVFAGERGLYATTDGVNPQYISSRVEPVWETLDNSSWRKWHAVHWRRRSTYILFCSDGTVAGRNNMMIVWDYSRNAFTTRTGIEARDSCVVEDETTSENRLYYSDYLGQLWEIDSPDAPTNNYGASRTGFTTLTGTVQSGTPTSTTTVVKLVSDGSLPVGGDGLRGVELLLSSQRIRILSNDTNYVTLESALSGVPSDGAAWSLGSINAKWKSGGVDFGDRTRLKQTQFVELGVKANANSTLDVKVANDEGSDQSFLVQGVADPERRVGPVLGRARNVRVTLEDDLPENPWEVLDVNFAWLPRGRSSWSPS